MEATLRGTTMMEDRAGILMAASRQAIATLAQRASELEMLAEKSSEPERSQLRGESKKLQDMVADETDRLASLEKGKAFGL